MTVYADQTKGTAFSSVSAWQKVRYCQVIDPISQSQSPPLITSTVKELLETKPSMDQQHRPGSVPQAHVMDHRSRARLDRLTALTEGNAVEKEKNKISREILKIEQKKLLLREQDLVIQAAHKQSETQMNDYKLLRDLTNGQEDTEAKEVLAMMKKKIIHKWLSS
ncbi:uncharacterized protein PGTG_03953 [Puccinia graminis f. sp. tritici CRL 75-36-700-3]|uniref:No apical meristem-associated C-terminal domain-containing protein n=1 Tax=Puccinia graminis f. sp. tritici (strain CRL 75-36-700-3 / race SCCL) TaxID=418459 RepID=E3K122_PUCGT|nr:uncharacterized protein PGTG_03953 [Puccinia graminis f. sp. tritici CRL 75-36-700-3]EFP77997.1 hypothetical protein PGTG_03953 [Puccinia graminis f. sp. tritici CRL 75-36-700-3]